MELKIIIGQILFYKEKNYMKNETMDTKKIQPAKRIDIVSLKMIKESSILYGKRVISCPNDSATLLREFISEIDREVMVVCCLDIKNQPTSISIISIGTLNSSLVHPREVFKTAIISNAASILISHNHPSGQVEPSCEDLKITNRIEEASKIIGIKLLDHVIIGDDAYFSFKEEGLL